MLPQLVPEVPHGRENQRDLVPVVTHIASLLRDLGHDDGVLAGPCTLQRAFIQGKLVSQHQYQVRFIHEYDTSRGVNRIERRIIPKQAPSRS